MVHRVTRKQPNSGMCLVCGLKNAASMKASFFEIDSGELVCLFTPCDQHQSYPGRLHGGLIAAMLDETIGRAVMVGSEEPVWGVTVELTTRFKKPVPLHVELKVVGRVLHQDDRYFYGTGELLLPDGVVAATAEGKYRHLPWHRIADFDAGELDWRVVSNAGDPTEFELTPASLTQADAAGVSLGSRPFVRE
jgi:acyl-coenzyme A thioesterase PaaI-like protein